MCTRTWANVYCVRTIVRLPNLTISIVITHLHVLVYQGSSVSTQDGEVVAKGKTPGQEEGPLIQSDQNQGRLQDGPELYITEEEKMYVWSCIYYMGKSLDVEQCMLSVGFRVHPQM